MHSFKLQDPGEGIHEAEILEVRVGEGDDVKEGDIVLVIETDKAAVEVPAPCSGSVARIGVSEGDVIEVGSELMRFDDGSGAEDEDKKNKSADDTDDADARDDDTESSEKVSRPGSGDKDESNQDKSDRDESDRDETDQNESARNQAETTHANKADGRSDLPPVLASPAARRLARERGVALDSVDGSGPDDRVLVTDIQSAADEQMADETAEETEAESDQGADEQRIPLRSVRRATARRMQRAWQEIPHVTHTVHADITDLSEFRTRHKGDFPHLTLTVLLLKTLSVALRQHPRFNASLDDDEIVIRHRHHFGVAVDTERGLLVPVLRDVDRCTMRSLASTLEELVNRARGGTLQAAEMRGGTFTITNVGASGASHFTPIINPPQGAILGVAQADLQPVAREGENNEVHWEAHRLLPLILAFDHRLNDGMDAARFMATLSDALKSPGNLLAAL